MTTSEPDAGGDSVCWMHRVCKQCGALADEDQFDREGHAVCRRCGSTEFGD